MVLTRENHCLVRRKKCCNVAFFTAAILQQSQSYGAEGEGDRCISSYQQVLIHHQFSTREENRHLQLRGHQLGKRVAVAAAPHPPTDPPSDLVKPPSPASANYPPRLHPFSLAAPVFPTRAFNGGVSNWSSSENGSSSPNRVTGEATGRGG